MADPQFPHRGLRDGDTVEIGDVVIRALETPGNTPQSLTFLVYEHRGDAEPWGALTGDTLLVGDVGRVLDVRRQHEGSPATSPARSTCCSRTCPRNSAGSTGMRTGAWSARAAAAA